jgi:hypothetical protein
MNCSSKIVNLSATIGSKLALQIVVTDDDDNALDLTTGWRFAMQARTKTGADSDGATPTIELEADGTATIDIDVPEGIMPQTAVYDVIAEHADDLEPVLEGILVLKPQITDITE